MGGKAEELLRDPIELANSVLKALEDSSSFKHECSELIAKVEKLADLLYTVARVFGHSRSNLYERPVKRIMAEVFKTLDRANALLKKCKRSRSGLVTRLANMISKAPDFRRANVSLDASIGDVTWLLNVCGYVHQEEGKKGERGMEGLPPIASMDPMLAWVWEQIALVHGGSPSEREEAACSLASLAKDNVRNRRLIIDEAGVRPLLKLLKDGTTMKGRIAAASALGTLASAGFEWVQKMHDDGTAPVFLNILQEGPMKLQAKVSWAIAEMAAETTGRQNAFFDDDVVRLLVSLLIFESIDRSRAHKITLRSNTMHSLSFRSNGSGSSSSRGGGGGGGSFSSMALISPRSSSSRPYMKTMRSYNGRLHGDDAPIASDGRSDDGHSSSFSPPDLAKLPPRPHNNHNSNLHNSAGGRHSRGFSDSCSHLDLLKRSSHGHKEGDVDPAAKRELKVEVTLALWKLAKDNVAISQKITETKALICLAEMIEKEAGEVQRNAVMAVMEIAACAEQDAELRRFAFKTNSRAAKSVVQQLLRIIIEASDDVPAELVVPCVKAIGCLARTFPAKEVHIIEPLVLRLGSSDPSVVVEACLALQKFVHEGNFLHVEHSKTISDSGAVHRLIEIVSDQGEDAKKIAQLPALRLLCYLAQHLPSHEVFLQTDTHKVLRAMIAGGPQPVDSSIEEDLLIAIQHLELYQGASKHYQ